MTLPQPTHTQPSQAWGEASTISHERQLSGVELAVATVAKWPFTAIRDLILNLLCPGNTPAAKLSWTVGSGGGNQNQLFVNILTRSN